MPTACLEPTARRFGVDAVYLFGSVARGVFAEDRDYNFSINEGDLKGYFEMLDFVDAPAYSLCGGCGYRYPLRSWDGMFVDYMNRMKWQSMPPKEEIPVLTKMERYCEHIAHATHRFGNSFDSDRDCQASCVFALFQIGENVKNRILARYQLR